MVSPDQLAALEPYIGGAKPDERGEIEMLCPLHEDSRRSASVNIERGVWYCHAGCGGGSVRQLVGAQGGWVPLDGRAPTYVDRRVPPTQTPKPTLEDVSKWHRKFMRSRTLREELYERRGITAATAKAARVGHDGRHYKLPVFGPDRELWNVRTYDMHVKGDRRKIWSVRGWGQPRLYPVGVLERAEPRSTILWCEGEWDTLLALQTGVLAVTRTGGAKAWHHEWDIYFDGADVYLCHDADAMGVAGNNIVGEALQGIARSVRVCELPYPVTEKHGRDLTDLLTETDDPVRTLAGVMKEAKEWM